MILERFSAVVFIGDNLASSIYTAFNILLREDLALGGLQQWRMTEQERIECKCDNQFANSNCLGYAITSSEEFKKNTNGNSSPYYCERKLTSPLQHLLIISC